MLLLQTGTRSPCYRQMWSELWSCLYFWLITLCVHSNHTLRFSNISPFCCSEENEEAPFPSFLKLIFNLFLSAYIPLPNFFLYPFSPLFYVCMPVCFFTTSSWLTRVALDSRVSGKKTFFTLHENYTPWKFLLFNTFICFICLLEFSVLTLLPLRSMRKHGRSIHCYADDPQIYLHLKPVVLAPVTLC